MTIDPDHARDLLHYLCIEIPERPVGSEGNRAAARWLAEKLESNGFLVETPEFDCIDWSCDGATLTAAGRDWPVEASLYTSGCDVTGPLVVARTLEELRAVAGAGRVVLVLGELAKEQLMPKNFPFYNPASHQEIVAALEGGGFAAVVAGTGHNPELAGGQYPFPLVEDGDFVVPVAQMRDVEAETLAEHAGLDVGLRLVARRRPSTGWNVIGHKGDRAPRLVLCAHLDAKPGTPGAIDNGTGIVALVLLSELLADYAGETGVEILGFNGEDYYCAPGQQLYLEQGRQEDVAVAINLDGAGIDGLPTAFSLYECDDAKASWVRAALVGAGFVEGPLWYQGDHSVFVQSGRPAVALTSHGFIEKMGDITHTPKDHPGIVDPAILVEIALGLEKLVRGYRVA